MAKKRTGNYEVGGRGAASKVKAQARLFNQPKIKPKKLTFTAIRSGRMVWSGRKKKSIWRVFWSLGLKKD